MKEFIAKSSSMHLVVLQGLVSPGRVVEVANPDRKWWKFWVPKTINKVFEPKLESRESFVFLHEGEIFECPQNTKEVYPLVYGLEA